MPFRETTEENGNFSLHPLQNRVAQGGSIRIRLNVYPSASLTIVVLVCVFFSLDTKRNYPLAQLGSAGQPVITQWGAACDEM